VAAERVPLDRLLDPLPAEERALWDRYAKLVAAAGPSEPAHTRTQFAFRTPHRRFTGGFFKSRRLEIWFDLPEPVPEADRDERFRTVWEKGGAWVHRLKIERPDQLGDDVGRWLAEAWQNFAKPAAER
jgi:hypothetical protein